jgi:hypothetical protein
MIRTALATVFLVSACPTLAEVIEYEIYELSQSGIDRKLIAKGKRNYSVKDVEVRAYEREGQPIAEKLVELEQGYRVGARIFYQENLTGFGLLARRSVADFSWEWYNKDVGSRFKKLRGGTFVEVKTETHLKAEELVQVTFLDDTNLRFIAGRATDHHTHSIIIKAGSILRLK